MIRMSLMFVLCALWAAGAALLAPTGAAAVPESRLILAVVGPDTITTADLDAELAATLAAAKGRPEAAPLDAASVLKRLIQNRLLEQEGYRIEADKTPMVQNQVRDLIRVRSVRALMDSVSAPAPGEAVPPADSLVGMTSSMRRYSHILVKDEAEARSLRDSLTRGAAFSDLARRHSIDGTAPLGGDLGWAPVGAYVDAFEAAGAPLSLNQTTGPVQTSFGWHLITLTGARTDTLKSKEMADALLTAREKGRRTAAVESYVDGLKRKYGVTINDSLLSSLDYKSADPAVQKKLQQSEEVLAVLPTGRLMVKGLTRTIRFRYFHGLADRNDAEQIRDRMFGEWVTEALLSHEAHVLGFERKPEIVTAGAAEERRLVREEVLKNILTFDFKPQEEEIRSYYEAHRKDFVPIPRVRLASVLLADEQGAQQFKEQVKAGADLKWLAARTPGVVDSVAPFPTDWVDLGKLGMGDAAAKEGTIFGPLSLPDGWAVVQVTAIENPVAPALDECRDQVTRAMRNERTRAAIEEAIARLESATPIRIQDGAEAVVAARIDRAHTSRVEGAQP
jgi:peptidyl-prolyl cis-trans isomerase C